MYLTYWKISKIFSYVFGISLTTSSCVVGQFIVKRLNHLSRIYKDVEIENIEDRSYYFVSTLVLVRDDSTSTTCLSVALPCIVSFTSLNLLMNERVRPTLKEQMSSRNPNVFNSTLRCKYSWIFDAQRRVIKICTVYLIVKYSQSKCNHPNWSWVFFQYFRQCFIEKLML